MKLIVTLLAVLGGAGIFHLIRIPAGALLGAVVGSAAVNLLYRDGVFEIPGSVRFVAFALLGWAIGSTVTRESLTVLADNALVLGAAVVGILVATALIAAGLNRWSDLDPMTSYLATSPGALSQMTVTARDVEANAVAVIAVHTARVICVLATVPIVTRFLER